MPTSDLGAQALDRRLQTSERLDSLAMAEVFSSRKVRGLKCEGLRSKVRGRCRSHYPLPRINPEVYTLGVSFLVPPAEPLSGRKRGVHSFP